MSKTSLLSVRNLKISFGKKNSRQEVIHDISFTVAPNRIVGIVGESGSGKSVTSLAIMKLIPSRNSEINGQILFEDQDLLKYSEKEMQRVRGKEIAMIFQEPMSALNPSLKCGFQVMEILMQHEGMNRSQAKKETLELFQKVRLPRVNQIFQSYPHQISGGQMQRVMIAMAIACKPKLLIADEPTTALDVTVQKEIIELLKELQKETKMSLIFISHDLSLVSEIAQDVIVMYQGDIVEQDTAEKVFKTPEAKYTKALLASRPTMEYRLKRLPTIASLADDSFEKEIMTHEQRAFRHKNIYTKAPLLEVRNIEKHYLSKAGLFQGKEVVKAVDDVSFRIYEGETVGLVGESGCGKSTLGKTILQLEKATAGHVIYRGTDLTELSKTEVRKLRKEIQLIFQDPYSSLNPRIPIGKALTEPMKVHGIGSSERDRKKRAIELLEKVGLTPDFFDRYPHELSGGQRQRVGIARTIAMEPKLIICDESVSALDISVQAQVLNLLNELKEEFGFTYLFISHDLAVVKFMSDQLLVMNQGGIEEIGDADEIYANPRKEYTQKLIEAIPRGIA